MAVALEPFGQVENSLARSFEGTGLGLPLARRMTELHGGRLTLRSVKGRGDDRGDCIASEPDPGPVGWAVTGRRRSRRMRRLWLWWIRR